MTKFFEFWFLHDCRKLQLSTQNKDCKITKLQDVASKNCKSKYQSMVWRHSLPLISPLFHIMGGGVSLLRIGGGDGRSLAVPVVIKPGGITRDYDVMCLFCQVFIMRFTVRHDEWFFEQSIFSLAGWRGAWCRLLCTLLCVVLWAR